MSGTNEGGGERRVGGEEEEGGEDSEKLMKPCGTLHPQAQTALSSLAQGFQRVTTQSQTQTQTQTPAAVQEGQDAAPARHADEGSGEAHDGATQRYLQEAIGAASMPVPDAFTRVFPKLLQQTSGVCLCVFMCVLVRVHAIAREHIL